MALCGKFTEPRKYNFLKFDFVVSFALFLSNTILSDSRMIGKRAYTLFDKGKRSIYVHEITTN